MCGATKRVCKPAVLVLPSKHKKTTATTQRFQAASFAEREPPCSHLTATLYPFFYFVTALISPAPISLFQHVFPVLSGRPPF
jgi:hypothetical protein